MKKLILALLLVAFAVSLSAQTATPAPITNLYAFGASYNNAATPAVAGTALYARSIDTKGTYAFTAVDLLPTSLKPFTVTTNMSVGTAQKLFTIGKVSVIMPVSAGLSVNGSNTGWNWNGGVLLSTPFKKNWRILPNIRFLRSNVSNGSGYQVMGGVLIGFGK